MNYKDISIHFISLAPAVATTTAVAAAVELKFPLCHQICIHNRDVCICANGYHKMDIIAYTYSIFDRGNCRKWCTHSRPSSLSPPLPTLYHTHLQPE